MINERTPSSKITVRMVSLVSNRRINETWNNFVNHYADKVNRPTKKGVTTYTKDRWIIDRIYEV